jgi:hypothetical protein
MSSSSSTEFLGTKMTPFLSKRYATEPLVRSDGWFRKSNVDAIHHFLDCVAGQATPYNHLYAT